MTPDMRRGALLRRALVPKEYRPATNADIEKMLNTIGEEPMSEEKKQRILRKINGQEPTFPPKTPTRPAREIAVPWYVLLAMAAAVSALVGWLATSEAIGAVKPRDLPLILRWDITQAAEGMVNNICERWGRENDWAADKPAGDQMRDLLAELARPGMDEAQLNEKRDHLMDTIVMIVHMRKQQGDSQ